jgi:hypothetical protein
VLCWCCVGVGVGVGVVLVLMLCLCCVVLCCVVLCCVVLCCVVLNMLCVCRIVDAQSYWGNQRDLSALSYAKPSLTFFNPH